MAQYGDFDDELLVVVRACAVHDAVSGRDPELPLRPLLEPALGVFAQRPPRHRLERLGQVRHRERLYSVDTLIEVECPDNRFVRCAQCSASGPAAAFVFTLPQD